MKRNTSSAEQMPLIVAGPVAEGVGDVLRFGNASWARAAAGADVGEIYIYDDIGAGLFGGIAAADVARALDGLKGRPHLRVYLNSPGGDVFEGVAIYNLLSRFPAKKTVSVDGLAASIASIIALAGDHIVTAANASWMIHNPRVRGMSGGAAEMRKAAERIDALTTMMAETYAKRTGRTMDEVRAWMADETWMDAPTALARGFCHEVEGIRKDAAPIAAWLDRFEKVPETLRAVAAAAGQKCVCGHPCSKHSTGDCAACKPDANGKTCVTCGASCSEHTCTSCGCKGCSLTVSTAAHGAPATPPPKEKTMEFLKLIAARLGMNADASEAAIVAALVRLQEEVQSGKAEAKASRDDVQAVLTLSGKPTTAEALGVFQAWKAGADQVGTLSARVTEMERASAQREIDGLIAQGQKDGKLPPSLEAWAKTQSVVSLQAFLAAAVPVVTTAATEKKPPDDKSGIVATLSDEQKKIAANLGVKPEDLAARVAAARA